MDNQHHNLNMQSEHAVVLNRPSTRYGSARAVDYRPSAIYAPGQPAGFASIRFALGEVLGLLFVVLSTLFIFALPSWAARREQLFFMINQAVKRSVDLVGAIVGLVLSLPLFLIVPILIKLGSRGPVFYTQTRIGENRRRRDRRYCQKVGIGSNRRDRERRRVDYHGRPFQMIKFRTMVHDAERKSGPVWAAKNDPRVTRIGAILRRTRLDEVPQFLNVLVGDMALVGPRPERPAFVQELAGQIDQYTERLQVKPGVTGLAQVENGYDSSLASVNAKVQKDLDYIKHWSVWSDLRILAKTVVVVLTGRGAH